MIWLIDSRNRVATGKRVVRQFNDDEIEVVWRTVLAAEVREPEDRKHYEGCFFTKPADTESEPDEIFNSYWSYYGWHMMHVENDTALDKDMVEAPKHLLPPITFDPNPAPTRTYVVVGQVHLSDGFTWDIVAESEQAARRIATARANQCTWSEAEIQEVCIDYIQEN